MHVHFDKVVKNLLVGKMKEIICSQFLLGLTMIPRENKTMLMQNLGGQTKRIMVFSELAYMT